MSGSATQRRTKICRVGYVLVAAPPSASASRNGSASFSCVRSYSISWRRSLSSEHDFSRKLARSFSVSSRAAWYSRSTFFHRSGSISSLRRNLSQQPNLRQLPISLHRLCQNLQDLCRFLGAQASEEFHFNHSALPLIEFSQAVHSLIECH